MDAKNVIRLIVDSPNSMFPCFDVAHNLLAAAAVRQDLGSRAKSFSKNHPLACWISTMLVIFSGQMFANFLLAEPILSPLKNTPQLIIATLTWYIVFYSPGDYGYKIGTSLPVTLIASVMKEMYRAEKVYNGVIQAHSLYPNAVVIMIIIGTVKGNGAGFTRLLERLLRGSWTPNAMEVMQPSLFTKVSILASIIFVIEKKTNWIQAPHEFVHFVIVVFFIYCKVCSLILKKPDIFVSFENACSTILFGDASTALNGQREKERQNESAIKNIKKDK